MKTEQRRTGYVGRADYWRETVAMAAAELVDVAEEFCSTEHEPPLIEIENADIKITIRWGE